MTIPFTVAEPLRKPSSAPSDALISIVFVVLSAVIVMLSPATRFRVSVALSASTCPVVEPLVTWIEENAAILSSFSLSAELITPGWAGVFWVADTAAGIVIVSAVSWLVEKSPATGAVAPEAAPPTSIVIVASLAASGIVRSTFLLVTVWAVPLTEMLSITFVSPVSVNVVAGPFLLVNVRVRPETDALTT